MEKLIAIMPAYNEGENIASTVKEWIPAIRKCGGRLIIINDGSTDNTGETVEKLMKSFPELDLVSKINSGHGPAVIYGYRKAIQMGADWIFQTDSDGQTNPDEFQAFWKKRNEYDAILGMRPDRQDGLFRKIVEFVLRFIICAIFSVRVPDANAPFRLMRAKYVSEYLDKLPDDYSIPNVMLTVFFVGKKKRVLFKRISFMPRSQGKNKMNLKRIIKIGIKSLFSFISLRKECLLYNNRKEI